MDDIVTVKYMLKICQELVENGYGDIKLRCNDAFIHEGEIGIYPGEYMKFRGNLFNEPVADKVSVLKKELGEAMDRFFIGINESREEGKA